MSDSILTLTGLPARPGATISDIEAAEGDLGVILPEDYRAFLLESDGVEGFSGPNGDYLMFWGAKELGENNRGYEASEFAPGLTLIGSDGGGNAFGFIRQNSERVVYVRVPFIDLGLAEPQALGATLIEVVRRLRGERCGGDFYATRFVPVREALTRARAALPASAVRCRPEPPDERGSIGTLDQYDELMGQYEHEVAFRALATVGRAVAAPPEFWTALDDACRLMGFDEAWRARECRP